MGNAGLLQQSKTTSIDLIYDELSRGIEYQRDALEALQNKAGTLLGFSGAILALLFSSIKDQNIPVSAQQSMIFGVGLAICAILLGAMVFWSRRLRIDPAPHILLHKYYDKPHEETITQIAVNRAEAFEQNFYQIERIALILRVAMLLQTLSIICIALAIVFIVS
ncbi:MAG: hypothetical protein IPK17_04645 [Chloroflexi bacterium]|uniref:hypothetical protein n=1 Tax=Candidatus Flexifilum breve TaxID=3140694 RepID=UPI003135382C|nr:hypothetical protein [Chloroflexota bacterium]